MPSETDHPAGPRPTQQGGARRRFRFEAAGGLVQAQIRKAGESRGFANSRIVTHWDEVAGPELARLCRPQRISYAKGGFGATLVLEVPGAAAPMVQMRLEALRARINSAFGYGAVARIQIVHVHGFAPGTGKSQSPASVFATPDNANPAFGMAEPASSFRGAPDTAPADSAAQSRARGAAGQLTEGVADAGLKAALARLALNVLIREEAQGHAPPPATPNPRKELP